MAKPFTSLSTSGDLVASYPTHFWHSLGGERAEWGIGIGTVGGAVDWGQMNSMTATAVMAEKPLFTVSQWQELKLQVLIYKYLAMGNALPDPLVHHFRNSIESMVSRYYHSAYAFACHPPNFGKDLDLEPWRCRRTDGKKWRCSKEAYPNSKYCECHMHRGCKHSKKLVEEPPQAQSPCASTVTSLAWSGSSGGSFQSIPLNFLAGHPPNFGKDLDLEPWRCRRTDGKKWRCSKEAYPNSKYCERHMHRGCKHSKKLVEEPPQAQSPCASTVTSLAWSGSSGGSFQSIPLNFLAGSSNAAGSFPGGTGSSRPSICPGSYGIAAKEFRYPYGMKADLDGHCLFSKASGNARGLGIDSFLDNSWHMMPSQTSLFPLFKARNNSSLQSSNLQFPGLQDLRQDSVSSLSELEQQQHSFFTSKFGSAELAKHESGSLQPFFSKWPRTRDVWSDLEDEMTNQNSFSTTQHTISMPMTSSGFSTTNSWSRNDD